MRIENSEAVASPASCTPMNHLPAARLLTVELSPVGTAVTLLSEYFFAPVYRSNETYLRGGYTGGVPVE
jgi:hypothetical protein